MYPLSRRVLLQAALNEAFTGRDAVSTPPVKDRAQQVLTAQRPTARTAFGVANRRPFHADYWLMTRRSARSPEFFDCRSLARQVNRSIRRCSPRIGRRSQCPIRAATELNVGWPHHPRQGMSACSLPAACLDSAECNFWPAAMVTPVLEAVAGGRRWTVRTIFTLSRRRLRQRTAPAASVRELRPPDL